MGPSLNRRREIIAALRGGTVPRRGIELLAVGLSRFEKAIDEELERVALGHGVFKAVRGDYGTGKTFFSRWVQHKALGLGLAVAEVQISERETPLYRMETLYRRALENLRTRQFEQGAFRALVDRWFFSLEEEVLARPGFPQDDTGAIAEAVGGLLDQRLSQMATTQPLFATALRGCYAARLAGDLPTEEGLLAWLMGQPNVGGAAKRRADLKGEIDHQAASGFLRGLLVLLQQTGRKGMLLVLDEVETIQRVRGDLRERSLNALRQWLDDVGSGVYPGLYVMVTGTPAFFDGQQGVQRLAPLAQRLHVAFDKDPRFDNTRAIQIRLLPFSEDRLVEVGLRVRDLYPATDEARMKARVPDALVAALARDVAGTLSGKVGIAPRLFLKKLVGEVLDRVEEHADFDPAQHYALALTPAEMTVEERAAAGMERTADDIELALGRDEEEI